MAEYILSIDQGTTSSRAILLDREFRTIAKAQQEFPQSFPQDGWVEHDPNDILNSVLATARGAIAQAGIAPGDIAAIGITNQRETTLIWDRATGEAIHPAIVWQDRRTADACRHLIADGASPTIAAKTGLLIDPYFSATKIGWILDNVPGARTRAENGELAFGTVDTFLLWHLTGGVVHRTDATNAARTLLFDIHRQAWDDELLCLFGVPRALLPDVLDCSAHFGDTTPEIFGAAIPILGMAGDQQGALIGQVCLERGMAKSTYGTGCFVVLNTGDVPLISQHRLLTTIAYRIGGKVTYALEGSIFVAGAVVQWMRDGVKLIENAGSSEALAANVRLDHGVYFVPAFTGLGAPYWDPAARGAILGLTRDTGIAEIVSAGLQAVCYQTRDLQRAMGADGIMPARLRVDGGMVANNWLMQFLADLLGVTVERPAMTETTALGAAYLAALGAGWIASLDDTKSLWRGDRVFEPAMGAPQRDALYDGWQKAVARISGKPSRLADENSEGDSQSRFQSMGFLSSEAATWKTKLRSDRSEWFGLADRLNRLAVSLASRWQIPADDIQRFTAVLLFLRTVSNFQGAILLAERGMTPEARTLIRGAFESVFILVALQNNPDLTNALVKDDLNRRKRIARALIGLPKESKLDAPDLQKLSKFLTDLEESGQEDVGLKIEQAAISAGMKDVYDTYYRGLSNDAAHTSIASLDRYVDAAEDGVIKGYQWGLSTGDIADTVNAACTACIYAINATRTTLALEAGGTELGDCFEEYKRLIEKAVANRPKAN